jgi:hypothetical protein
MATVHLVLQKKGGVGKSMVSSFWMQFLKGLGYSVYGLDTDPSNKTFADFAELKVAKLEILDANDDIDPRQFDALVESIFKLKPNDHIVIDTGSSCYPALFAYLKHANPFALIKDEGHQVYVHTPLSGGSDMIATTECLDDLVTAFPELLFIVWKNRYHGDLLINDKPFEQLQVYLRIKKNLAAEIEIPLKNPATFGKDIGLLMSKKQTFVKAITSNLPVMVRQRLSIFWREVCEAMQSALVFDRPSPADADEGKAEGQVLNFVDKSENLQPGLFQKG